MALAPDAHHVFAGLTPANSAYYKDEVEQEMINEYGQGHQQDMQGVVHGMQGAHGGGLVGVQDGHGDGIGGMQGGGHGDGQGSEKGGEQCSEQSELDGAGEGLFEVELELEHMNSNASHCAKRTGSFTN
jgi:hypothetical protein